MRKLTSRKPLLFLCLLPTLFSLSTAATDTLTPAQPLTDGETLVSAAGTFALGFFSPAANSDNRYIGIWYNNIPGQTVVWVANRQDPITDSTGVLSISTNGTLIITGHNSTILWTAATAGTANPVAQLLDTGNFVVREANNYDTESFSWQSFDYPTDTLLPGMKLGWDLTSGLNRNLTSWRTPSDPSPGDYTIFMDLQGDPQLILRSRQSWLWRSGPWDGACCGGLPDLQAFHGINFAGVDSPSEISYSFSVLNKSMLSRLIVQDGASKRFTWVDHPGVWSLFWSMPRDQCDVVSLCGEFGVCDVNDSPTVCGCLQGFEPRSPANWAVGNWSDGCARKTELNCENGTDGFVTVRGAKLPDTSSAKANGSMSLEECRDQCLRNCSCTAYAASNISGGGDGSGCIVWSGELTDLRLLSDVNLNDNGGQDLYVRLAASDLASTVGQSRGRKHATIPIIICMSLGMLTFACIGCCIWRKKKKAKALTEATSFNYESKEIKIPIFDMDTVVAATKNFSFQNKLGEGGFGPVYKGNLEEKEIAIKRLAKTSMQGIEEFKNEVLVIAKLQHKNLVQLLGYCIEGEERMLIYEFMPNKSLDFFLFGKAKDTSLDWQMRYHIISGIARGLLYLHHDSRPRIIHRDLKASNILLDKDMNPKISDFGMARIFGGDQIEAKTRKVVGTYGYMSPEYAMDGTFSIKSDVFSFGVLLLEVISGKRNRGIYHSGHNRNLLGHAWSLWKQSRELELVDDSISHSCPTAEVLKCIKLGLLCVQECPKDRPTMSSVVLMLGSVYEGLPHPKEPGFATMSSRYPYEPELSATQESKHLNKVTSTVLDGR